MTILYLMHLPLWLICSAVGVYVLRLFMIPRELMHQRLPRDVPPKWGVSR